MQMTSYKTPAKINWTLKVVGRRADGYHLLDSIFVPVWSLCDFLDINLDQSAELKLTVSGPFSSELSGENILSQTLKEFNRHYSTQFGATVTLVKNIPVAAGLGGGSSDAGRLLRVLGEQLDISTEELIPVAAKIGADVPFFLDPKPSHVSSIGDVIKPIEFELPDDIWLIKPNLQLSATEIYHEFRRLEVPFSNANVNNLELAIFSLCPELKILKAQVSQMPKVQSVTVSGSGPTLIVQGTPDLLSDYFIHHIKI